jgi:hypothetical protein
LCSTPLWNSWTHFIMSDNYGSLNVWLPLLRKDASVIYSYSWFCHSLDHVPQNSRPYLILSFETPQPREPDPCTYVRQEESGLVISPGNGSVKKRKSKLFSASLSWYHVPIWDTRSVFRFPDAGRPLWR